MDAGRFTARSFVLSRERSSLMFRNNEKGQVLALTALLLVVLLIAAGFAVDMGYLRYSRRLAQTAADAAALAGASQIVNDPTKVDEAAIADAGLNNFQNNWDGTGSGTVGNVSVACSISTSLNGTGSGCDSGATTDDYVSVTVTKIQPTFFAKVMGIGQEPITAHAVAHLVNSINCLTATGSNPVWNAPYAAGIPAGYQFTTSLTNNGGAMNNGVSSAGPPVTSFGPGFQLDATGCSVTAPTLSLNLPSVCLHGASINDANQSNDSGEVGDQPGPSGHCNPSAGAGGVNPYPPSQIASTVDPLAGYPTPTQLGGCSPLGTPPAEFSNGVVPNVPYPCGLLIDGAGTVTLSGFYSVNGITITNTGVVQGTNVTIYNSAGSLGTDASGNTIYGAVNVDFDATGRNPLPGSIQLSAPSDTGILFFQDRNNPAPATISLTKVCGNASSDSYVQGALYFPDTQLTLISSQPNDTGCAGNSQAAYTLLDASEFLFEGWLTISAPANGPFANTSPIKKAVLAE